MEGGVLHVCYEEVCWWFMPLLLCCWVPPRPSAMMATWLAEGSIPSSALHHKDSLIVTAYLSSDGHLLHHVPVMTYNPSTYDTERQCTRWDDLLTFPIKYRDLCATSQLVFTVWGLGEEPVGGTTLRLFDETGLLKTGRQKLQFYFFRPGDGKARGCATPGEAYDSCGWATEDYRFAVEKGRERYSFNQVRQMAGVAA